MTTRIAACPACGLDLDATSDGAAPDFGLPCPACGHGQTFHVEDVADACVVHLKGRGLVTEQNVMRTLERVRFLLDERGLKRVLLNFDGVTYLSSTILGRLINLARQAKDRKSQLKLCGIRPDVRDIFRLTRLEGYFDMFESQEQGLAAFLRPIDLSQGVGTAN